PGGLMPDMHLDRGEAADLAAFLIPAGERGVAGEPLSRDAALVEGSCGVLVRGRSGAAAGLRARPA
ncbi:MAG: hypothetical protein ACPGPE_16795, partial [Planctomycetota bacterium]